MHAHAPDECKPAYGLDTVDAGVIRPAGEHRDRFRRVRHKRYSKDRDAARIDRDVQPRDGLGCGRGDDGMRRVCANDPANLQARWSHDARRRIETRQHDGERARSLGSGSGLDRQDEAAVGPEDRRPRCQLHPHRIGHLTKDAEHTSRGVDGTCSLKRLSSVHKCADQSGLSPLHVDEVGELVMTPGDVRAGERRHIEHRQGELRIGRAGDGIAMDRWLATRMGRVGDVPGLHR